MPKVNVYLTDDLAQEIKGRHLPMSEICREALWTAVDKEVAAVCKKCKGVAVYHIRREDGSIYSCVDHVVLYLTDPCTVRPI